MQQIDEALTPTNTTTKALTKTYKHAHFEDHPATKVIYKKKLQVPMAAPPRKDKPLLSNEPKLIVVHEACCHITTTKPATLYDGLATQLRAHVAASSSPTPEPIKQPVMLSRRKC